ncbi:MAG TPA: hypothetical protein VEK86_02835 [Gemmatimonadales bacterium]|nr:hypothetical protein [Gemmatimonadales bacterium]
MKAFRVCVALACSLAACQPQSRRALLLDLALSDPLVLESTAAPWHEVGYTVEYRRFYPHLTRADLARYRTLLLLGGREPEAPSDALTLGDLAILNEWLQRGGVVVLGYAGDGEGFLDRWIMNRWLAALGAGIVIGDYPLKDTIPLPAGAIEPQPAAWPLPQSALDNAGIAPFPAGRNHVLLARDPSQVLARTSATAFIRPPRETPAPRPGAAVVAASRVADGLVLVVSRHALAAAGIDLRPSTLPAPLSVEALSRTRAFLEALARWTRRPAEWASVAPAGGARAHGAPLALAGAPRPVATHPPPLAPPPGTDVMALPRPAPAERAREGGVPPWISRQGMRVLWGDPRQRSLESMLALVDAAALNVLATEVQAPARADSLGLRNAWRPIADRLQATSVRWFPAMSLADLRPPLGTGDAVERDVRGDTVGVWCALDSLLWRDTLRPAYRALARLGGGGRGGARSELIAGVALDLDAARGGYAAAGFCDATYREGLRALGADSGQVEQLAALPPAARYDTLLERGWLGRYYDGLERLVAQRAAAIQADVRRLNPDARFAFRSAEMPSDWFSLGLLRGFSAPDAPVLLWTRERRVRDALVRYHDRGIFALSAVDLAPEPVAAGDWPRLRGLAFVEHDGFWLPLSISRTDSLGRLIRRLAK